MALYNDMRPKIFDEVIGNTAIIKSLKTFVKLPPDRRPHTYMFSGSTGCGKTTLARILANEFCCHSIDLVELNAANTRGIDTVREIVENASLSPMSGGSRVYILDECFLGRTRILIDYNKSLPIKDVVESDNIKEVLSYDLKNKVIVKKKIVKKIKKKLEGVIWKTFVKDNDKIYQLDSTRNHKIYVKNNGYLKAEDLKVRQILIKYCGKFENNYRCYICDTILDNKKMYIKHIISCASNWKGKDLHKSGRCKYCDKEFRYVRQHEYRMHEMSVQDKDRMRKKISDKQKEYYKTEAGKKERVRLSESRKGKNNPCFRNNNKGLKKIQEAGRKRWKDLSEMEKEEQIKRFINAPKYNNFPNKPESVIIDFSIKGLDYVGDGSFFVTLKSNGKFIKKNPDFVYRKRNEEGKIISARKFVEVMDLEYWHKDDWKTIENAYKLSGFKVLILDAKKVVEDKKWVRGKIESFINNDSMCVCDSPKTSSGRKVDKFFDYKNIKEKYIYNIEVEETHNYFALAGLSNIDIRGRNESNDLIPILVSNSHQFTKPAQQSLLKVIEDVPPHSYFIFCTTDPNRIIPTIRNRCSTFQVELLNENNMTELLEIALDKTNKNIEDNVFYAIVDSAEGCPREALVLLETVLSVDGEKEQISLLHKALVEHETIELCRALIKKESWKYVAEIYRGLPDTEPELIRRAIMGYMRAILIKGGMNDRAAYIIGIFEESTFNSGSAMLVRMLYEVSR